MIVKVSVHEGLNTRCIELITLSRWPGNISNDYPTVPSALHIETVVKYNRSMIRQHFPKTARNDTKMDQTMGPTKPVLPKFLVHFDANPPPLARLLTTPLVRLPRIWPTRHHTLLPLPRSSWARPVARARDPVHAGSPRRTSPTHSV